tara:strand:- start:145 stop:447 length:303 start_codon:yes stop_codon:yes gene_type:complete
MIGHEKEFMFFVKIKMKMMPLLYLKNLKNGMMKTLTIIRFFLWNILEKAVSLTKEDCMKILSAYGYTGTKAEECSEEWVSKGHVITAGIVKYYQAYFINT